MDGRTKRDGKSLEILGYYHPLEEVGEKRLVVNLERVDHWIGHGALPTEAVGSLLKQARKQA
jgi:small subunit ribosomal protein S16